MVRNKICSPATSDYLWPHLYENKKKISTETQEKVKGGKACADTSFPGQQTIEDGTGWSAAGYQYVDGFQCEQVKRINNGPYWIGKEKLPTVAGKLREIKFAEEGEIFIKTENKEITFQPNPAKSGAEGEVDKILNYLGYTNCDRTGCKL